MYIFLQTLICNNSASQLVRNFKKLHFSSIWLQLFCTTEFRWELILRDADQSKGRIKEFSEG
ncbi:hypothetical protein NC651_001813 [Populus alba x Populus x berolinensis]|nr:hypothetical protein NC651_001813 [Populus alba x Populus x berolinensis]